MRFSFVACDSSASCRAVEATEAHVTEALRLFQVATLDAAQSGIVDSAMLSEEQRKEVQVGFLACWWNEDS